MQLHTSWCPDVSVIVPVYNKAEYVGACLESVLDQAGVFLEVICVDDASSDDSLAVIIDISERDQRVHVVRNSTSIGAGESRNKGLQQAKGKFVQFTDADDLLPAGALEVMLQAAQRLKAEVVKAGLQTLRAGVTSPWVEYCPQRECLGSLLDVPEVWVPWFHQCYLISRDLIARAGISYPQLIAGEDPVFISRVLSNTDRICTIPMITYTYRNDGGQRRRDFQVANDYIAHAELVREIYGSSYVACWERYRSMIKPGIEQLMSNCALSESESQFLIERLCVL
jgi:glycosyltransferase involved in cell wall biosynthesis